MKGEIFNIQKFSINDGPGIRTTVFLKGCPLRCLWCHNPESQSVNKQILFYPDKCTGCGRCKNITAEDKDFLCFSEAKEICGKIVSSDEVISEVMKDYKFYENSGGGITLSGGEPLFQFEFAAELLKKAKQNNLYTAIETCGFVKPDKLAEILDYVDLFLYDFKESDEEKHKRFTGVGKKLIMENLRMLCARKKDVILRCPVIPGYNDRKEHFDAICDVVNSMPNIKGVDIEPYHSFGEGKYGALGEKVPEIRMMNDEEVEKIINCIGSRVSVEVKKA